MEVTNRYIVTKTHIDGALEESHFELKTASPALTVEPGSNDVVVKNLYVSIDPYQLNRMKSYSSSKSAIIFSIGITPSEGIDAYGVARVVASGSSKFEKDDLVVGLIAWGEYSVVKEGNMLSKLDPMGFLLTHLLHPSMSSNRCLNASPNASSNAFASSISTELQLLPLFVPAGFSGLAAYGGFFEVCQPKKGEKVFVSAASGSVGNLVGQYAKLFGCYVVGCAGSKKKVELLKEKLGFDEAFNYKDETDLKSTLKGYFPDGIDIYFDNVGSEMLEAAVANVNNFGRVAVCGVISEYTSGKRAAPDMLDVVYKRITIRGFLAADYMNVYSDFISTTSDHLCTGNMQALEDITPGVENIPSAFIGLFSGDNVGKKIVKIADE
ncbi:2-alkenal reductase (NADP(+)-dependent)-like [Carya illinoinensis]|uniref:2-alkenal reductase (NADP(+)-dependent)-like n=1 Tax=Carya illinoinensis TaxID=32201 RepID=UPI001C71DC3A|nr:2-alkenal reductase (NADP(+)-dependent)-like [Carya illinoinensis]